MGPHHTGKKFGFLKSFPEKLFDKYFVFWKGFLESDNQIFCFQKDFPKRLSFMRKLLMMKESVQMYMVQENYATIGKPVHGIES